MYVGATLSEDGSCTANIRLRIAAAYQWPGRTGSGEVAPSGLLPNRTSLEVLILMREVDSGF